MRWLICFDSLSLLADTMFLTSTNPAKSEPRVAWQADYAKRRDET